MAFQIFGILLQTARGILNSLICVSLFIFLIALIVYSTKKIDETYWSSSIVACQGKRTDCILRVFTCNEKNLLYLPIISILQFFEDQSD